VPLYCKLAVKICYVHTCRFIALPIGRHFKLRENVSKPVPHNDTLEKLFRRHRKIYPSDSVISVITLSLAAHISFTLARNLVINHLRAQRLAAEFFVIMTMIELFILWYLLSLYFIICTQHCTLQLLA